MEIEIEMSTTFNSETTDKHAKIEPLPNASAARRRSAPRPMCMGLFLLPKRPRNKTGTLGSLIAPSQHQGLRSGFCCTPAPAPPSAGGGCPSHRGGSLEASWTTLAPLLGLFDNSGAPRLNTGVACCLSGAIRWPRTDGPDPGRNFVPFPKLRGPRANGPHKRPRARARRPCTCGKNAKMLSDRCYLCGAIGSSPRGLFFASASCRRRPILTNERPQSRAGSPQRQAPPAPRY